MYETLQINGKMTVDKMNTGSKQRDEDIAIGIYVHVPFCASTCDFCAFYQEKPRRQEIECYLAGVEAELKWMQCLEPVDTLFWGGGTPGLLPAKDLERLGGLMHSYLDMRALQEWTIEMAPSAVKADKIRVLQDIGVSRISMGVQSFQADMLDRLGRLHNPAQIYRAYDILRSANFANINLDMLFAIPGQSAAMWARDLTIAMDLAPEHISTYCLTFEEDTALWVQLTKGQIKRDIEHEADLYLKTWAQLEAAGYGQYEISNFARPGHACMHNLNTWNMRQWCGFGPSAASQYRGSRFTNVHSIEDWLQGVAVGKPRRIDTVQLDDIILACDSLVFGLRMNAGVQLDRIGQRFPQADLTVLEPLWSEWVEQGLMVCEDRWVCLTSAGRMLADAIGSRILAAMDEDSPE